VVDTLNQDPDLHQYIGPVSWNIDSQDWGKWRDAANAEEATGHILCQIEKQGFDGILLMHDCSTEEEPKLRENNRAWEVARLLMPKLIAAGYRFRRLDEVPLTCQ
jgi:hypothetical protein